MKNRPNAAHLLRNYLDALCRRDLGALDGLVGSRTLLEIPFLKPGRLLGKAEISTAHREILDNLERIDCHVEHCLDDGRRAIAAGRIVFKRRIAAPQDLEIGMVVECDGRGMRRLSLYCDTRNLRRWSDKSIM